MWLMTQGSRQLPASPVPKALLTSQPSRALWVRAAPQVPTCLMLAGCPQLCGPLMSPDTVQCPLRWGGRQHQPREGDSGLREGGHTGSPSGARGREGRTQAGRARGHCILGHGLCSQPCGEAVRTQLRAGTRSTPVLLQQPAKRQTVQVHDSMQSPGSTLPLFHKGGTLGLGRLVGTLAPAGQPSKAPRPPRNWSSQPGCSSTSRLKWQLSNQGS